MGATKWTMAAVLLLAGCGGDPLSERDPHGYEACTLLIRARTTTDVGASFEDLLQSSREAKRATTPQIRDAVKEVIAGYGVPDGDQLVEACEAEGVEVPAATPKG